MPLADFNENQSTRIVWRYIWQISVLLIWADCVPVWLFAYSQNRAEDAEVAARQALSADAHNAELRFWLGKVMEQRNLIPEARKHYQATLQLDPKHKRAKNALKNLK